MRSQSAVDVFFHLFNFLFAHLLFTLQCNLHCSQLVTVSAQTTQCTSGSFIDCRRQSVDVNRYRTIEGKCNNLKHPNWGAGKVPMLRLLLPNYENDQDTPIGLNDNVTYHGFRKPNPRKVSTNVMTANYTITSPFHSVMVAHWGQLVAHDITHAQEMELECAERDARNHDACFNIQIPIDDKRLNAEEVFPFKRSKSCMSRQNKRQQVNQLSAYIDASPIYGINERTANLLRDLDHDDGTLKVNERYTSFNNKEFLPFDVDANSVQCFKNTTGSNKVPCFLAGDVRANEQLMLMTLHTLLMREHNRIVRELRLVNRHWDGDRLYQEGRKILGAVMQQITYREWLTKIIGSEGISNMREYRGYDAFVNAGVANSFATAVMRFGHATFPPVLERRDELYRVTPKGDVPLREAFFAPEKLLFDGGLDPLLRGAVVSSLKEITGQALVNTELTDHLFPFFHKFPLDLAALNIQRGRDHALPSYNSWREFCGLERITHWYQFGDILRNVYMVSQLQALYKSPENLDLWVGGLMEQPVTSSKLGPTFTCIIINQFRRLRDGDRFWFENPVMFTNSQVETVRSYSLARLICNSADAISRVPQDVFRLNQVLVHCSTLPDLNLRAWRENVFSPNQEFFEVEEKISRPNSNSFFDGTRSRPNNRPSENITRTDILECESVACRCRYQVGTWGPCDSFTNTRRRLDILASIYDETNAPPGFCKQFRFVQEPCTTNRNRQRQRPVKFGASEQSDSKNSSQRTGGLLTEFIKVFRSNENT